MRLHHWVLQKHDTLFVPKKKKIDYSLLPLAKKKTIRSPKHLNFVRSLPCSVCKTDYEVHAHHLTHAEPGGMSKKTNDNWVVPLCGDHHYELHYKGEKSFWKKHKLEPKIYAALLWYEQSE